MPPAKPPAQSKECELASSATDDDGDDDDDALRDRIKARRFMDIWDSLSSQTQEAYQTAKGNGRGEKRQQTTQMINNVIQRRGNKLAVVEEEALAPDSLKLKQAKKLKKLAKKKNKQLKKAAKTVKKFEKQLKKAKLSLGL